ncbi:MAG: glycosyltransferase family 2 protein [Ignavibacteria bacterium]|nr:glycosyltransferase family 2 protein [Ignavibacteria bacterium]
MQPDLSVIIVNYNTRGLLRNCLESLFKNGEEIYYEVIIVDNDSSDGSREMITRDFPTARLICNSENSGFAKANNVGLEAATAEFILLLNSDTVITAGNLSSSISYMHTQPDVGILGSKVLNPDGTIQQSARDFPTLWTLFLETFFLYKILPHSGLFRNPWITDTDKEQDVDVVKGAYFLTRRKLIDEIGALDERFFLYSEEQDWCLRAKRSGWRVVYLPSIATYHHDGGSSSIHRNSPKYYLFDSEFKYFQKHFGSASAVAARLLMFIGVVSRLLLWLPSGVIHNVAHNHSARAWDKVRYYWFAVLHLLKSVI